jgi:hypothetical protein
MPHRTFPVQSPLAVVPTVAVALTLVLGACQKQEPAPDSNPPAPAAAAASEPGAPEIGWADKSHQQRLEYMGIYVLPKMDGVFKGWKESQYQGFKCQTCHGDDMDEVNLQMPNDLFPLDAEDPYKSGMDYDEDTTKFMAEQVLPAMTELLGEDVSCLTCHPAE